MQVIRDVQAKRRLERDRVREEETVDAERASTESSFQHTGKCAV